MTKTFGKPVLVLLAIAIFSAAAIDSDAQEKTKDKGNKGAKRQDAVSKMIAGLDLTAEQQAKVKEIRKEYRPKLSEIQKRRNEIMTPQRRKTEKEARQAAKDLGKKGKQLKAEIDAALGLSPAESEKLAAIDKERQAVLAKINADVRAILTDEQKAKLPEPGKKQQRKQKNKPDAQ
jgi:Spy/CpxP family protein refolding chaperone